MTAGVAEKRIRLGVLALPVAGALQLATVALVWGEDTRSDRDWAELVVSARYEAAQVADLLSVIFYVFGFFALYACMARTRGEGWALGGLVLLVPFVLSFAVVQGTAAAVDPFLGRRYLQGDEDAFAIYESAGYTGFLSDGVLFVYAWFEYPGLVLLGVGVWRSGLLPQGAVVLGLAFAAITPLAWAVSPGLGFLGPLLLVIAEGWMAWAVWQGMPPPARSPSKTRARVR